MKTISLDFDGVLSDYHGWKGPDKLDPPLPGAIEWLKGLLEHYQVVIHSTRDTLLLAQWFREHAPELSTDFSNLSISHTKPVAWLSIDDRSICFDGRFPTVNEIEDFKPWWQR